MLSVFVSSVDITTALEDALDSAVTISFGIGSTVIEVRSEKPLTSLYWDIVSTHDGALLCEYYDGSAYVAVGSFKDTTGDLTKSGWTTWSEPADESKQSGTYRYKFTVSGVTSAVSGSLKFVGIIFSEDKDIKKEYPNIYDYLPSGDTSFIRFHVSAKDQIVQYFRAKGNATVENLIAKNLTEFDFLDIGEVKQAAKFYALAKIFFWLSDSPDDKYYQKYRDYLAKGNDAAEVYYLSLDKDRDGKMDDVERLNSTELVIRRG